MFGEISSSKSSSIIAKHLFTGCFCLCEDLALKLTKLQYKFEKL